MFNQFFVRTTAIFVNPLTQTSSSITQPLASPAPASEETTVKQRSPRIRRGFMRWGRLMMFLLLALSTVVSAQAQETTGRVVTDDEVNAIAHKLYCPVCENITLDTCGTSACADWRYEIRLQLEQGMTETQIVEDFVRRFGDRVVGTPLDPTLRALSLYTPWLVVAAALFFAGAMLVRRRSAQAVAKAASVQGENSHYVDLFEQDLSN